MKILIFGANGFIGKNVCQALGSQHDLYRADRSSNEDINMIVADLLDVESVIKAIKKSLPEIIINCAGIVENTQKAIQNVEFSKNILKAVLSNKIYPKIIISGSSAEYGIVKDSDIPVNEGIPLNATSEYGLSKKQEITLALEFSQKHNLPIVVARIFNPIGIGMHQRLLVPSVIRQVKEIRQGKTKTLELNRLDTKRDYVDVRDVARAFKVLAENDTKELVYNIGSGNSTTNGEVIDMVLSNFKSLKDINVTETSADPEPLYAMRADIKRIKQEFGWKPKYRLGQTIREIVNDIAK